ncbi:Inositol monophosphatase family protein isoform 3, partial [Theobroma cacao]
MSINWLRVVFPSIIKLPPPLPLRYSSPSSCSCFSSVVVAMSYDKELTAAKKAASLAARLCQKVQKSLLQSDVQSKNDRSPVTVADYGSQALVSFVLQQEFPAEFSLVAEEDSKDLRKDGAQELVDRITKLVNDSLASDESYSVTLSTEDVLKAIDSGKSEGGSQGRHWVLDPIDGTKGFLRGGQYAIALALLDRGKVVLGVLACPNLPLTPINDQHSPNNEVGCLFFAEVGGGSYMQPLDSSSTVKVVMICYNFIAIDQSKYLQLIHLFGIQVQVSGIENPEEASFFESYEAAHSMHDLSSLIAQKLGVKAPPVRIDSQVKYGALSRGDGAIYMRLPHKG